MMILCIFVDSGLMMMIIKNGRTALIMGSGNGQLETLRTLLKYGAAVEAKTEVRNQIIMIIMITAYHVHDDDDDCYY